ncbi:MAG TPA: hypothetical protein VN222_11965 [Novosphingobium sp.]|nr:hypothetical protein [Novosphingobium sp.]
MVGALEALYPVLARGMGHWSGHYTHLAPDGTPIDRHRVDTFSAFPGDGGGDFLLRIWNRWDDGRDSRIDLRADHNGDALAPRLLWRERLVGAMWEVGDTSVYLDFHYAADPALRVCEMIQIAPDGQTRARTWHWFRDERLIKITLTHEWRTPPGEQVLA